jgi:glucose/arabinose dehydrogenase
MMCNLFMLRRKLTGNRRRTRRNCSFSCRPVLERLEDRVVPTVLDTLNFSEYTFIDSSDLSGATGMAWAPDGSGRLFVTRKGFNNSDAEIRVVQYNSNGTGSAPTLFATVSPIFTNSECGLIGITFDRDFINNHFVYVFATVSASEQQIIRYTDVGGVGMNKTVLISGLPTVGQNHDGGGIVIGPDNKLYWSIGDLGNRTGVDLDLTTLAAKIGRANLDGSPVSDNPFNDNDGIIEPADYIWARGWRNPFTMTVQELPGQATPGRLWVDVAGTSYEQIFQPNVGDHAGYDNFENNQPVQSPNPNQYIVPKIKYRTNGTDTRTIAATNGAVRSGNVVTFTTTTAHFFRQGERIAISGVADSSFNGTFYIQSANNEPTTTSFTVAQVGPNATSGGGTAQTQNLGGAVTGSTFYDGTDFGPAWRGNYFFADYNSGRINRATLDANNNVTSVEQART